MLKLAALACVLVLAGCPSASLDAPSAGSGVTPAAPPAEGSATPASGEPPAAMPTSQPTEASAAAGGHDHAGHDHAGHDHAGHDHAGHDHGTTAAAAAGHDHAGHDHAGHDHAGHDHGTTVADPAGLLGPDGRPRALNPGEMGHYGAAFTIAGEPMSLASAIETCADSGQSCKVTGTIDRVCQRAGCWFTLAAPDVPRSVRVQMLNYGFFVPRNTPGAAVVLEGTLARTTLTQEQAQHYADDEAAARNTPPEVVTGPVDVFEFTIAAADVTLPAQ